MAYSMSMSAAPTVTHMSMSTLMSAAQVWRSCLSRRLVVLSALAAKFGIVALLDFLDGRHEL